MSIVRYTLTLHPVQDAQVIVWLEQQPNVAAAIREALYQYLDQPSRAELGAKLDQVLELLHMRPVASLSSIPEPVPASTEPEAAVKGLGKMLSKFQSDRVHTKAYE